MIVFEKVTLQNFLSYGNDKATLELQRKNPTLITGINHDASINGEMDSNGCGKSSLLMAITFALYDQALGMESLKKDGLINNINKKDLLVEFEFKVREDEFKISRYRKNKAMGGNGVKIEKNGKDITPDSISNANSYIAEEIIRVPYEIFSRIITYAANEESFLKMPLAKQREVIEELFSYTELSKKADTLKEQIKSSKIDLKYAIDSNEEIKVEHIKHERSLREAKQNIDEWDSQHKKEIGSVEKLIEDYQQFDFDQEEVLIGEIESHHKITSELENTIRVKERELHMLTEEQERFTSYDNNKAKKMATLEVELEKYQEYSEVELVNQIKLFKQLEYSKEFVQTKNNKLKEIEKSQDMELETLEQLETEQSSLRDSKCPYCSQEYKDAVEKLEQISEEIGKINTTVRASLKSSKKLEVEIVELTEDIQNTSKLLYFDTPTDVEKYSNTRDRTLETISTLTSEENPLVDRTKEIEVLSVEIEELGTNLVKHSIKTFNTPTFESLKELFEVKGKLNSAIEKKGFLEEQENPYEKSLEALANFEIKESKSEEIVELEKIIKHQEFLLKLLTKKDSFVRKALMDKYLPFLNERLRYYLGTMGLPHKAHFISDLSMEISQFDREISFTNLSSGQKARINIALSLAFRDVLQSKHNFINLYILDECLDVGLSNVGVRKTVKLIKEVADSNNLSMFIISHRDEIKDSFKDQVHIELKNGFSKIKSP